jgi:molybdate transport system ATP-binding protein
LDGVAVDVDSKPVVHAESSSTNSIKTDRTTSPVVANFRKTFAAVPQNFALHVEFSAPRGITILFGASGAGKTTLLNCFSGLETPEEGRISLGDVVLFDKDRGIDVPVAQRKIGYVFQDLALFPHLTVEENIRYGIRNKPRDQKKLSAGNLARVFRIDHLLARYPSEISGGERQRVALARALITEPCLLLLDEPVTALDAPTKSLILDDLLAWNHNQSIPILYVTHNRDEVFAVGDWILVLEKGRIVAQGTPQEVMSAPQQESVAQLVGFENIFDATVLSVHPDRGTMTCRLNGSQVDLETPLLRAGVGAQLRIGIRAGDILLATQKPLGLSAQNVILGKVAWLVQRDAMVILKVDCGVEAEVHVTLSARDSLHLSIGREVWLVLKTHSCHLMTK